MDLSSIMLAINLAAPHISNPSVKWYGKIIDRAALKGQMDPLIIISVITHESHWNPNLISSDEKDLGLMQIRAKYSSIPEDHLLNPATNIQIGTALLKSNYNYCEKFLDREPSYQEYGSCYAGLCKSKKRTCKPSKISNTIVKYAQCLEDSLVEQVSKDCSPWFNYEIN